MAVATGTAPPDISSISGITGISSVATDLANSASLILNTAATLSGQHSATLVITSFTAPSSTATATASASGVADASSSASKKGSSIPMGTVIGICVGVFVVLSVVLLLVLWMSQRQRQRLKRTYAKARSPVSDSRNDRQNEERRKSGREVWVKMEDNDDDGYEKYAMKRTSTSPSGIGATATVERSVTVKSAKSAKTFKSYGAGLGLADTFKTPEIPPRLEFTDSEMGLERALPPFARNEHESMMSWDGETIAGGSFLSLKRRSQIDSDVIRSVGAMSPSMVVSHQTPPATSTVHAWHEAEVISPDGAYGGFDEHHRHPFAAPSSTSSSPSRKSQETIRKSKNPFLDSNPFDDFFGSASQPPPATSGSATSAPSAYSQSSALTTRGTFAEQQEHLLQPKTAQRENQAMQSLIAALNISPDEAHERLSAAQQVTPRQSMRSSVYTDADSASLHSERFPLPPTDIEHHKNL